MNTFQPFKSFQPFELFKLFTPLCPPRDAGEERNRRFGQLKPPKRFEPEMMRERRDAL
jgi:hypothetical protein